MSTTTEAVVESEEPTGRWGAAHYLAVIGVVLVVLQAWTWAAWFADGPSQTTEFQTPDDAQFMIARMMEIGAAVTCIALLTWIVVRCVRERRIVFDAILFIAGLSALWLDAFTNFVAPIWLYNTNFTNTQPPTAYMPFVVNPTLENMPFPTLFHLFNYPVACVGAGIVVSFLAGRLRERFPTMSTARLLGACFVFGVAFDLVYETFMFRSGMWAFPGTPDELAIWGSEYYKFPIFEMIPAGIAFASFGALRFFRNDRGEHITERGFSEASGRARKVWTLFATIAIVNLTWLAMCSIQVVGGFYADPYKPMPRSLLANICDGPLDDGTELTGTAYGPCPEQGGTIPIRGFPTTEDPP